MYERKPHGNKGRKHTQATREKIAAAMRNNTNGIVPDDLRIHPQRKEKGQHALKGKPKSAEHKRKIAAAMRQNKNASRLERALKLQTPVPIRPQKTVSQRFNESPQEYRQRKAHSPDTIAKIRAAAQGNHNALKQYTPHSHTPVQQEQVTAQDEPIDDLEAELMAMLGKDKTLPLHAAPPKPYDLQETPEECAARQRKNAEEVLGKDFFDGWELTDE